MEGMVSYPDQCSLVTFFFSSCRNGISYQYVNWHYAVNFILVLTLVPPAEVLLFGQRMMHVSLLESFFFSNVVSLIHFMLRIVRLGVLKYSKSFIKQKRSTGNLHGYTLWELAT
ncbi:hypothetical protein H5410_013448 [Solanum commersonii]|uniref:Uncharacterized protein n=1 Tax=Solanum commersonii TaxID=4109 RepID=A0A9J6AUM0_SOLCO|nr:hypothetical protein H5410_013448 [Solanum commersonii]